MHLNIREHGIFVVDKSVYIIQLDKAISIVGTLFTLI